MTAVGMPVVPPSPGWTLVDQRVTPSCVQQVLEKNGRQITVLLERASAGVFREAFPSAEHDLRLEIGPMPAPDVLTELLEVFATRFGSLDPLSRRLVYSAPEGDLEAIGAAERAGFRFVVDVEVVGGTYSLMVVEPAWVSAVDMDLDRVPSI